MIRRKLTLWHGSDHVIQEPDPDYQNPRCDYGCGFYCTESKELALEWSVSKNKDGIVNKYQVDCDGLNVLNLHGGKYNVLNWLSILVENRKPASLTPVGRDAASFLLKNYSIDYVDADIIIGYRADDSYFTIARDFLNNSITISQLSEALRLGRLGDQVVLKSKKAFKQIRFIGSTVADKDVWWPIKDTRDRNARETYIQRLRGQTPELDYTIRDLMRGGKEYEIPGI